MGVDEKESGQATVELALLMPMVLIVAFIGANALCFIGDCAMFDRIFREAVCVHATSPCANQGSADVAGVVQAEIERNLVRENIEITVAASSDALGYWTFSGRIEYLPTLFGMGLRSEFFGMPLLSLKHEACFSVDSFSPGGLLL